jgi:high-affinity iron transporter
MLGTALLVFREVLEAALIVTIVLAATRGVDGRGRWIGGGIGLGVIGAVVVAMFAGAIADLFSGVGQELFNASVLLAAVVMIAWHVIWMASHGKELSRQMKAVGNDVQAGSRPLSALLLVVAIAVLREGSESVLFLYGQAASGSSLASLATGTALGIVGGVVIGVALYAGLVRIPMKHFFSATNWMLLLLAAGMASNAARYLIQADVLPALSQRVWDTSRVLDTQSVFGQTLHTLIGYDPRPSGMQLVFYVATATLILLGMRVWGGSAPKSIAQPAH